MILIDLTQIIIASCVVHKLEDVNLIKHSAFSSILSYKKQYEKKYGKIVLACDSKSYWRRDYFPAYKGQRKHSRESSSLNWDVIFKAIDEIKQDLRDYFPYKLLQIDGAEADDVIATMAKYTQVEELVQEGLFDGEPQPTIIISADQDFVQLQKYKNINQFSPMQKKIVKCKGHPETYLLEHIIGGDGGDNVPNVLTSDQWAIDRMNNEEEKSRQKPIKKTFIDNFTLEQLKDNDELARNYARNKTLIDFDCIPNKVQDAIINAYINYEQKGNKTRLMNYFLKNKMKLLFAEINSF